MYTPWTWVSRYQNVSIPDYFVGAKDDGGGGDNWSCKTCKAPVKLSPLTNQHAVSYMPDALPVTNSGRALNEIIIRRNLGVADKPRDAFRGQSNININVQLWA